VGPRGEGPGYAGVGREAPAQQKPVVSEAVSETLQGLPDRPGAAGGSLTVYQGQGLQGLQGRGRTEAGHSGERWAGPAASSAANAASWGRGRDGGLRSPSCSPTTS